MLKKVYIFLFLLFSGINTFSQGGSEFWFAPPEITSLHAEGPVYLQISTFDKSSVVVISQPANRNFKSITVTIPPFSFKSVELLETQFLETTPPNQVLNTGLLIRASSDINVFYEIEGISNRGQADNPEIFVLKGNNALGTLFYVPMQTKYPNQEDINAWSSMDIIATEDNTEIWVTPTQDLFGHKKDIPFLIRLNKGQTFSMRSASILPQLRPSGTRIVSNKPIAVTYKDDSILKSNNWDLIGDQILPVSEAGTEYAVIRNSGTVLGMPPFDSDNVFIVSTENGNELRIGSAVIVLNEGETYNYHLESSSIYFTSSIPVIVYHVTGFFNELAGAVIPPLACTGSKSGIFIRSNYERFGFNLLVKSGGENNFFLNGNKQLIDGSSFRTVPGSMGVWKYLKYNFDHDIQPELKQYLVENSSHDFQLSIVNGDDETGFRYGYFSGFGKVNLGPDKSVCSGDTIYLNAGLGKNSYLWNNGSVESSIPVIDSGTYIVTVLKDVCTFSDTVKISKNPVNTQPILGRDTAACQNLEFTIHPLSKFAAYNWEDNSRSENYKPQNTGNYVLEVTDTNGCTRKDSLLFTMLPIPNPEISLNNDLENYCNEDVIVLSINERFKDITWFNGEKNAGINTPRINSDLYTVVVTNDAGCTSSDTLELNCNQFLSIPNVFTPNGDSFNETFKIKNLKGEDWELMVYNRWGTKVFEENKYENNWQAEGLPDGVYFYNLKNKKNEWKSKGWIQVIR